VSFSNNLQNNQALQKASREFTAWIVSVNHKEIYRTIKLCKEPTECHSQKNNRTVKFCKQPTECHSQTIFRNNQALQAATKEFRIWIRIVIHKNLQNNQTLQEASTEFSAWRKSFPEHSSFAISQQRVQCINCQLLLTKNLQNNSSGLSSQHGVHQCMEESRRILCGDLVTTAV
jgi:hypothetical protein